MIISLLQWISYHSQLTDDDHLDDDDDDNDGDILLSEMMGLYYQCFGKIHIEISRVPYLQFTCILLLPVGTVDLTQSQSCHH